MSGQGSVIGVAVVQALGGSRGLGTCVVGQARRFVEWRAADGMPEFPIKRLDGKHLLSEELRAWSANAWETYSQNKLHDVTPNEPGDNI